MRPMAWKVHAWLVTMALAAMTLFAAGSSAAPEGVMAKFTLTSTDFTEGGRIANAQVFN